MHAYAAAKCCVVGFVAFGVNTHPDFRDLTGVDKLHACSAQFSGRMMRLSVLVFSASCS